MGCRMAAIPRTLGDRRNATKLWRHSRIASIYKLNFSYISLQLCSRWRHHFNWHGASRGSSAKADLYAEGLIFYRCGVFLLSFFRRLISEVTERISTKLGYIFTYDCYLKNLVRTPRPFTYTGWGQKNAFGTDFGLWPNISMQRNMISTIGKTCQSTGTPLHDSKFVELWFRNGFERLKSFCPSAKFSHWKALPALPHGRCITDSRQTSARVMQCHELTVSINQSFIRIVNEYVK